MSPLLLTLIAALCVAGYIGLQILSARSDEAREEAERDSYRCRIAEDPTNAAALEALGDSYRRSRKLSDARRAYQAALDTGGETSPPSGMRFKLRETEAELRRMATQTPLGRLGLRKLQFHRDWVLCPQCGTSHSAAMRVCSECEASLPKNSFWEALCDPATLRASLEGAAVLIILVIVLHVFLAMPPKVKASLVVSTTLVLSWRFLLVLEDRWRL